MLETFSRPTNPKPTFGMKVAISSGSHSARKRNKNSKTTSPSDQDTNGANTIQQGHIISPHNRMSLEKLRTIWNDKDECYTDTQLLQIRDWFYTVAEVSLSVISRLTGKSSRENNLKTPVPLTISIPHTAHNEAAEESYSLHPRIYRRAG